jgi:endonuclease/exonuclease/phosphatase family metal-dependent hydrolase
VIAIQEADRCLPRTECADQIATLAATTGLHGTFGPALLGDPGSRWTAVPDLDPGGPAYGVGLLTRVPLRNVRRTMLPGGGDGHRSRSASLRNPGWDREPRVVLAGEMDIEHTAVHVATTHLSYLPWRGLSQLRAALAVLERTEGPALLIGDFNLPAWPVRLALSSGWSHAGGPPTYPSWRPRLQIDQLLVRGGLWVHEVAVMPPATSDHLPLLATLALPCATTPEGRGSPGTGDHGRR